MIARLLPSTASSRHIGIEAPIAASVPGSRPAVAIGIHIAASFVASLPCLRLRRAIVERQVSTA